MTVKNKTLEQLYVATPCTADWDKMRGTKQVRFCNQCQLNVYNISEMTKQQAENLIASTEGKLCTKLFRRSDGTIITQDCPVGLMAVKKRVSKIATATFGFLLSLFTNQTIGWADDGHKYCKHFTATISKLQNAENIIVISGVVSDQHKAVIPNAFVRITNDDTKETYDLKTNEEGEYRISLPKAGTYSVRIQSPGFSTFDKKKLKIQSGEELKLDVILQVGSVGGSAFIAPVDTKSSVEKSV